MIVLIMSMQSFSWNEVCVILINILERCSISMVQACKSCDNRIVQNCTIDLSFWQKSRKAGSCTSKTT